MNMKIPKYLRKGKTLIKVDEKGKELSHKSYNSINVAKMEARHIIAVEGQGSVRVV